MIPVSGGVRVWLASGVTDMRRGMNTLALQVQEGLGRDPHAGDLYVFRGRRGDLVKILWHDGAGISLYAKRLERGRFQWPVTSGGAVSISAAQLVYLLEGRGSTAARYITGPRKCSRTSALAGIEDVLPELAAFPPGPPETALVDGDAELGALPDEVEEEGFRGAHGVLRVGDGARSGRAPGPWTAPAGGTARLLAVCGQCARWIGAAWVDQSSRSNSLKVTSVRLTFVLYNSTIQIVTDGGEPSHASHNSGAGPRRRQERELCSTACQSQAPDCPEGRTQSFRGTRRGGAMGARTRAPLQLADQRVAINGHDGKADCPDDGADSAPRRRTISQPVNLSTPPTPGCVGPLVG